MKQIERVRGFKDIVLNDSKVFQTVAAAINMVCESFGYQTMFLPLLEHERVFSRTVGETSDIVSKEMYIVRDKNDDVLAIRPEGTAQCIRAIEQNSIPLPYRGMYCAPMCRYERPQDGRFRQFYQFGIEYVSNVQNQWVDLETVLIADKVIHKLGVNLTLNINFIGTKEDRAHYIENFRKYLSEHFDHLSPVSKERFIKNPLRILDSKEPSDHELIRSAPVITEYLSDDSKRLFDSILSELDYFGIKYQINHKLVRGLDYYVNTVFEYTSDGLESCNTVIGGGAYIDIQKSLGYSRRNLYCSGWAMGMERMMAIINPGIVSPNQFVAVVALEDRFMRDCYELSQHLARSGIKSQVLLGNHVSKQTKMANNMGARFTIFIGAEEAQFFKVSIKNMRTGEQIVCTAEEAINMVADNFINDINISK